MGTREQAVTAGSKRWTCPAYYANEEALAVHRIKLAVLSSLILVAVVACGSEMSSEMPAETRCITALVYLVQDHAHPVTVSIVYTCSG